MVLKSFLRSLGNYSLYLLKDNRGGAGDPNDPDDDSGSGDDDDKGGDTIPPVDEKLKITIDGEEQELTQDEIVKLAQQGGDYTKKTQDLARRIGEESDRKTGERIQQMIDSGELTGKKKDDDEDTTDPWAAMVKRIDKLETTAKGYESNAEVVRQEQQLEGEIKELKKTYSEMDEMVVLATMLTNPKADMADVAKWSHEKEVSKKDEHIKGYLKEKGKAKSGILSGKGATPLEVKKITNLKDAKEAAKEYLASQE